MPDLKDACFEMFDRFIHIRTFGAFGISSGDSVVDIMRQSKFPTTSQALLPDITLPVYDL